MGIKSIALGASAFLLSTGVNAAIISADWLSGGDNLITQDTDSGLEWLDLTATSNRSYDDISTKLGVGQEFDGWRYATAAEVSGFFDAFGGDSDFYSGWSTQNNGLFDIIAPYWGDLRCMDDGCAPGEGYSYFFTAEPAIPGHVSYGLVYDDNRDSLNYSSDFVSINRGEFNRTSTFFDRGSALVRETSVVPVPAAAWLFGSGFLGLVGVARRNVRS